jgi:adenosylhomocysteine nucleosidase
VTEDERRALQCDLLLFVATQTEEEQVLAAAPELGIAVEQRNSPLGDYYHLGQVGDSLVNAVRVEMGPLSSGGSASAGILFQQATTATGIIQVGMAFGVDRNRQAIGDVLVSTALLPYDARDARTQGDRYIFEYQRVRRHPAKESLVRLFQAESDREEYGHRIAFGELLSGAARVFSRHYLAELLTLVPGVKDGIIGGEMEGVGLLSVSPRKQPLWIVVKGICDFADEKRDAEIVDNRPIACRNAARFVLATLQRAKQAREF